MLYKALRGYDRLGWTWELLQAAQKWLGEMWKHDSGPQIEGLIWLEQAERLAVAAGAASGQQWTGRPLGQADALQCLQWAEEALATATELLEYPGTAWRAHIATLNARLAAALGKGEIASREGAKAAAYWRAMGNDAAAEQVLGSQSTSSSADGWIPHAKPLEVSSAILRAVLEVQGEINGSWSLTWVTPQGARLTRMARSGDIANPHDGTKAFVRDWRHACYELSRLALEDSEAHLLLTPDQAIDLELVTDQQLAWLPWEMAFLTDRRLPTVNGLRWLWRRMNRAASAWAETKSKSRVVVFSQQVSSGIRGSEMETRDVAAIYEAKGVYVATV